MKVVPFSAAQVTAIGTPKDAEGWPKVEVGPDQTYELRVLVTLPASASRSAFARHHLSGNRSDDGTHRNHT